MSERQRCEIWSRVMGYARPISDWNIGKQGEFEERKYFTEKQAWRTRERLKSFEQDWSGPGMDVYDKGETE